MTITDFYNNLPEATAPKTEFVKKIVSRTGKGEGAVRLWVKGKAKPSDEDDILILEEETGLSREELFQK